MNIREQIIYLLKENYMDDLDIPLTKETDLIKDVKLDSVSIIQLIVDVENIFHISFNDVDLLAENFNNIGKFCSLIEKELLKQEL